MPASLELAHGVGVFVVLCVLQAGLGLLWVQRRIGPDSVPGISDSAHDVGPGALVRHPQMLGLDPTGQRGRVPGGTVMGRRCIASTRRLPVRLRDLRCAAGLSVVAVWVCLTRGSNGQSSPGD